MADSNKALEAHGQWRGKIEIASRTPAGSAEELAVAYTPGVAEPCKAIAKDARLAYAYTRKWNSVAVVTDGSAVLGLGNIGALAGLPVMEGKAVLFKEFGDVDAFPILVDSQDVDTIVRTVQLISPGLGGVNLEDIAAPRCFEIEKKLKETLDIPVFHDDQHGTAVVVVAALINALRVVGKQMEDVKVIVNGAGAAGTACANLIMSVGVKNVIVCEKTGVLSAADERLDESKKDLVRRTNPEGVTGTLADALIGADVFVGVSAPNVLTKDMVSSMAKDAIVFAMANPDPEILPDQAKLGGARVVGTGRSDFPNQINNVLVFPGIFRGALDVRASQINEEMKLAAAYAIADLAFADGLSETYILPQAFDSRVKDVVSGAVAQAAMESDVARI